MLNNNQFKVGSFVKIQSEVNDTERENMEKDGAPWYGAMFKGDLIQPVIKEEFDGKVMLGNGYVYPKWLLKPYMMTMGEILEKKLCGLYYDSELNYCEVHYGLFDLDDPNRTVFKIDKLNDEFDFQNMFIKINTIYEIEHQPGDETSYTFSSEDDLELGDMVICDTCYGERFGRIIHKDISLKYDFKYCRKVE